MADRTPLASHMTQRGQDALPYLRTVLLWTSPTDRFLPNMFGPEYLPLRTLTRLHIFVRAAMIDKLINFFIDSGVIVLFGPHNVTDWFKIGGK